MGRVRRSTDDVLWRDALRLSLRMMETGLTFVDRTLQQAQSFATRLGGEEATESPRQAPPARPENVEEAAAELANRLLRVARSRDGDLASLGWRAFDATLRSLPRGSLQEPRRLLAIPFQLPIAMSTLAVQETLRSLVVFDAVRPELWVDFFDFVIETFSELPVYFSLQYDKQIKSYEEHLRQHPNDAAARLELGRTFMKCGLFEEAVRELNIAVRDPRSGRRARYERMVSYYRLGDYGQAIRDGVTCLEEDAEDELARYWLWLAAQKGGGYPDTVGEELRLEVVAGYEPTQLAFDNVAAEIGLDKTSGGRGTAVFDSNGDGSLDVVIAGAHSGVSLFRNNGDGTFTDISTGSGLDKCVYGFAVAVGDYNNRGLDDLFITGLGFFNGQGMLMRNNGDGTFTDVTKEAGLGMWGPAFTATWVDFNGDGYLDLYVVNNLGGLFDRKTPNRLFRNNGDGTFTDVTVESGLVTAWPSLGAAWGDFSNNGRPDLFVSNIGRAQLFRNNGDGTFTDVSRKAGIDAPAIGSASLCCDIDNDGWLDIVQFTYSRPQDAIHTLRTGRGPKGGSPLRVFRNNRDGTFTNIASRLGLTGCWGTMSGAAGDVTNSGHIDILLGNGDSRIDRTEATILFENDGKRFKNVSFSAGLPFTGKGHGVTMADLAGDGRLHLIVGAGGLYPGDLLTTTVFRPKRRLGNYLNVRLVGTESNRNAIGARIRLRAGGDDQHRLVSGGSGFGSLPYEQHFGLGRVRQIDSLEIRWPGGHTQTVDHPPVNTSLRIVEGKPGWENVYPKKAPKE